MQLIRPLDHAATKSMASYFGSVNIYDVDVASLRPGGWVRTNVLAYDLARLALEQRAAAPPPVEAGGVVLLDPSVAQCMYAFRSAALGPVAELTAARRIVVPLNDYDATEANAGQHWSILAVDVARNGDAAAADEDDEQPVARMAKVSITAVHHDSLASSANTVLAQQFYDLLCATLFSTGEYAVAQRVLPGAGVSTASEVLPSPTFPRQQNGFDCGLFVCCGAAALLAAPIGFEGAGTREWGFDSATCAAKRLNLYRELSKPPR
jgi:hypothetical protein